MIYQILILGIIQGVTEFLPVSSDGHLAFLERLMPGITEFSCEMKLFINVSLHFATLLAVILFFRNKLIAIIKERDYLYILLVLFACIPTGIIGLALKNYVEEKMNDKMMISLFFCITGLVLYITRIRQTILKRRPNYFIAFIAGIFQGIAVLPGISRSAMTISCLLLFGINEKEAGDFSFIMSIPAVSGAVLVESRYILSWNPFEVTPFLGLTIFAGMVVAFISGFFSLKFLYRILEDKIWYKFSYYLFIIAAINAIV
ncbi:MAG: undecaprenyl-diphosphate phosphatase [Candidatus Hydrogenedentota bacterium]